MVIKSNWLYSSVLATGLLVPTLANAYQIEMNTALLQAMDKITGRVSEIEVPVNAEVKFGSFSIVVRACKATPPEETPENYAFVDVADTSKDGKLFNIFKGWMMSSSPALNAVEHPIYDVWLLKCINKSVDKEKLLSQESLLERDGLPKKEDVVQETAPSKEAIKAEEALAEEKALQNELENSVEGEQDVSQNADLQNVQSEQSQNPSNDLISEEDKLPIVSEIEETKVLGTVAESAQEIENYGASGINESGDNNADLNAPQPLLPNLENTDNTPQPLLNFTTNVEDKTPVEQTNEVSETDVKENNTSSEDAKPVVLEEVQVKEVVEPIVITNTEKGAVEKQKDNEQAPQTVDSSTQALTEEDDIPVEEDQFIEEDTITQ